jgi:hypothetical protein
MRLFRDLDRVFRPPKRPAQPKLEVHEGLGYDPVTGEAICLWFLEDEDGNRVSPPQVRAAVNTGFYFERVTQNVPVLGADGTVLKTQTIVVAPWNCPTASTIAKLMDLISMRGYKVTGFEYDDENQFAPFSHRAARIKVNLSGKTVAVAAGPLLRGFIAHINERGEQDLTVIDVEMDAQARQAA